MDEEIYRFKSANGNFRIQVIKCEKENSYNPNQNERYELDEYMPEFRRWYLINPMDAIRILMREIVTLHREHNNKVKGD